MSKYTIVKPKRRKDHVDEVQIKRPDGTFLPKRYGERKAIELCSLLNKEVFRTKVQTSTPVSIANHSLWTVIHTPNVFDLPSENLGYFSSKEAAMSWVHEHYDWKPSVSKTDDGEFIWLEQDDNDNYFEVFYNDFETVAFALFQPSFKVLR